MTVVAAQRSTGEKRFEPLIVTFCSNSVFFFGAPAMRASARKEKRLGKKKLALAFLPGRRLARLATEVDE
jgi:hypothetical protein